MKTCSRCGESHPLAHYYAHRSTKDRLHPECRACNRARGKERAARLGTKAMAAERRRAIIKHRYGISEADYTAMLEAQDNACASCHETFTSKPHIDHCHATGRVRALLCFGCNTSIGLMKESPMRLRLAADYIEHHQSSQPRKAD